MQPPPLIGDRATLTLAQNPWRPGELFFTICRAIVQIRLARLDDDGQELLAYGRRLAQRLEAVDCGDASVVPLLPEPLPRPPTPTPPPVLAIDTTFTATLRSFAFDPTEIGALAFADANHGWLAVGPRIYATDDGGGQWRLLVQLQAPVDRLALRTPLEGWADTRLGRLETRDGGAQWQASEAEETRLRLQPTVDWCEGFHKFHLAETDTSWALCIKVGRNSRVEEKTLFRSDDGGATWALLAETDSSQPWEGQPGLLPEHGWASGLFFLDAHHGWMANGHGGLIATEDGGATWNVDIQYDGIPPGENELAITLRDPLFISQQIGFVIVRDRFAPQPLDALYRTDDGGKHWRPIYTAPVPEPRPRQHHQLLDARTGFGASTDADVGAILRIEFTTPLRGWALHRKQLFSTTDGGQTWASVPLGRRLAQLGVTPDEQLWVITDEFTPGNTVQRLLTSRDGGAHWGEYQLDGLLPNYGGAWHGRLSFADAQHGWLVSSYGEVYYTQDGGASWMGL